MSEQEELHGIQKKRRFPLIRFVLVLIYIGLGVGLGIYEVNAKKLIDKASNLEQDQRYQTAAMAYMIVIEKFPLSFNVIEAMQGLEGVGPALLNDVLPDRLQYTFLEESLGPQFNPYSMDWLPFAICAGSAVLLALVFLSRLRRGGLAFLAFLLTAVAAMGATVQLVWYGFFEQEQLFQIADAVMSKPRPLYVVCYVLAAVTIMMTLTSTRRRAPTDNDIETVPET